KLEDLKTETLARLSEIQQQISQQINEVEKEPLITKTKPSAKYTPSIKKSQQKVQQLQKTLANKKEKTKQSVQKALNNPTPQTKKRRKQVRQKTARVSPTT